jgi:GNAT superfamily N-acetyltransferase
MRAIYVLGRAERVIGYYTLSRSEVTRSTELKGSRYRPSDPVPVIRLARLAIDRREQGQRLGGYLLIDALRRCAELAQDVPASAIVADVAHKRAAAFYRHFDFVDLAQGRLWRGLMGVAAAVGSNQAS